jgi:predicted nucleic-acid-binding Zn-ribbon protein
MKESPACPKCGSTNIIGSARLESQRAVRLAVDSNPNAWVLTEPGYSEVCARVCSTCGYVELYAQDSAALLEAWRKAQSDS